MEGEHKLNIHLTKEDYKGFVMHYHRSRFLFSTGFVIIFFAVILWVQFPFDYGIDFRMFMPVLLMGGVFSLSYFNLVYQASKLFDGDIALNRPYEVLLDANGIRTVCANGETNYQWKDIHGYRINKEVIYIFYTPIKGLILPLRSFTTLEEGEKIIELIKQADNSKYLNAIRKRNLMRGGIYLALIAFLIYMIASALNSH
jgi:hypothetical protein